jgi:hypothetical protein
LAAAARAPAVIFVAALVRAAGLTDGPRAALGAFLAVTEDEDEDEDEEDEDEEEEEDVVVATSAA